MGRTLQSTLQQTSCGLNTLRAVGCGILQSILWDLWDTLRGFHIIDECIFPLRLCGLEHCRCGLLVGICAEFLPFVLRFTSSCDKVITPGFSIRGLQLKSGD